ncbi:MAG: ZIP family metal transporter [Anaerolineales bacterium]|nr:ZIP family metal transporter [Anaerolineales bacterium]
MTDANAILNAFLLSLLAGLGTGLGGLIVVIRKPGKRMFGFLMGITAGVMITLAFHELVNEAWELQGFMTATIGFFTGAVFMLALDILIPHIRFGERESTLFDKPVIQDIDQETRFWRRRHGGSIVNQQLLKTGTLLAIGITIHNIPEGIAVGAGYMHFPEFGLFIIMAVMLHNIPEGIATTLPLCKSGVSRWNSFKVALFSGFAEPVGALLAALFLKSFSFFLPGALAFAGGVMVFITLDELLPTAREYGHQHYTAVGIILGAIFVFLLSGFFGV